MQPSFAKSFLAISQLQNRCTLTEEHVTTRLRPDLGLPRQKNVLTPLQKQKRREKQTKEGRMISGWLLWENMSLILVQMWVRNRTLLGIPIKGGTNDHGQKLRMTVREY
jgi:hypothetical protein